MSRDRARTRKAAAGDRPAGSAARALVLVVVLGAVIAGTARATRWVTSRAGRGEEKTWGGASASPRLDASSNARPALPPAARPWFEDAAAASGLRFTLRTGNRLRFPEIMSGGVCLLDFDGDGRLDVYLVQSGDLDRPGDTSAANRLFRNLGGGRFADVTDAAHVGDTGYGMGCACGDIDGDGDVDLYVTNLGKDVLYRNEGDGTFRDVSASALPDGGDPGWGTSAAFLDHDGDGDLDLFVTRYVRWSPERDAECTGPQGEREYCSPKTYKAPAPDLLLENRGDGTFLDASERAGLGVAYGNGLGVVATDVDGDGFIDVLVANDGTPNQLWMNREGKGFVDEALPRGVALSYQGSAQAGMGIAAFDLENDGDVDFVVSHLRGESVAAFVNDRGFFEDRATSLGLGRSTLPYTGFGIGAMDFDQDGVQDLLMVNGDVHRESPAHEAADPYAEPDLLLRGRPEGGFEELHGGTALAPRTSRGAAFGDLDGDGDIDVVVVDREAPVRLLRNIATPKGNWISFRVLDGRGGVAYDARVEVGTGGRTQVRRVQTAYSYLASSDPRVHFGIGAATQADEVVVRWPRGGSESFGPRAAGQVHTLKAGEGRAP